MNLGVDGFTQMTPDRFQPGIGLRPGVKRPDLEPLVMILYRAMYDSIAAHRLGPKVVVEVGASGRLFSPVGHSARLYAALDWSACVVCRGRYPLEGVMDRR